MEALELARVALARKLPYFATALYHLKFAPSPAMPKPILGAKDWVIYYSPHQDLSEKQVLGALYHELGHLLRDHAARAEGNNRDTWNLAADLELYRDAFEHGLHLPPGPTDLGLKPNLLAEQYYALLNQPPNPPNQPQPGSHKQHGGEQQGQQSDKQGQHGDNQQAQGQLGDQGEEQGRNPRDGQPNHDIGPADPHGSSSDGLKRPWESQSGLSESTMEMVKDLTALEVLNHSTQVGTLPQGLLRWASERLQPKVDWRRQLKSKVRQGIGIIEGAMRASFHKRHRRGGFYQVILPGRYSLVPKVAVVIDTSGSISDQQLSRTVAEVQGILRELKGHRMEILSVDARVQTRKNTNRLQEVELKGGGGTDMGQGIALAQKLGCDLCIVISDFYTPWPPKPKLRVIGLSLIKDPQPAPSYVEVIIAQ